MAEWLTHVLVAYAVFTALSWVVSWLDERWVPVAMLGALLPDLDRLELLLPSETVEAVLGTSFSWSGIHTLGGVALLTVAGATLARGRRRQARVGLLLAGGALSHLLVDLPQPYADGRMLTNLYLYPLPPWRPPTPGWYVSPDGPVLVVAAGVTALVFACDRLVVGDGDD